MRAVFIWSQMSKCHPYYMVRKQPKVASLKMELWCRRVDRERSSPNPIHLVLSFCFKPKPDVTWNAGWFSLSEHFNTYFFDLFSLYINVKPAPHLYSAPCRCSFKVLLPQRLSSVCPASCFPVDSWFHSGFLTCLQNSNIRQGNVCTRTKQ
jgi:hypothetical protein